MLSYLCTPSFHYICPIYFSQGETLENVASELNSILNTGCFVFNMTSSDASYRAEVFLQYTPLILTKSTHSLQPSMPDSMQHICPQIVSSLDSHIGVAEKPSSSGGSMEIWNAEQINDFVQKLGFWDPKQEGGDSVMDFLHVSEVRHASISY